MDATDSQLDVASIPILEPPPSETGFRPPKRFVGIKFACCGYYARVYVNRAGTAYVGHCPGCAKQVRLEIAPGGTDQRFFTAS